MSLEGVPLSGMKQSNGFSLIERESSSLEGGSSLVG